MAVSRQLDSVRVEQNHCHGLPTDKASYNAAECNVREIAVAAELGVEKEKKSQEKEALGKERGYLRLLTLCDCRGHRPSLLTSK
jgi:hypothetical protein